MEKRKLNIGILSDSPLLCTGYANQAVGIANILSERGHNVFYFAHAYNGQNLPPGVKFEDGQTLNFNIIGQGREPYFKDLLQLYVKQFKLDVLFILLDTFMLYPWVLNFDFSPAKTIFYFPSDGGGNMPIGCENILKKVDVGVAMARFGQEQVKKVHNIDVLHIPHATDTRNYFPLPKTEKEVLRKRWNLHDKFVIGTVARNQGRKMLDRTVKTMALYARQNPNAVLLMHTDPDDVAQVFPITHLINKYKIQNRVLFTGTRYYKGLAFSDMNSVYNLMDMFLLTTSGEGFGIPTIEAMACEVPVLVTDYTTTRELVMENNSGLGIDLVGTNEEENAHIHGDEILDGTLTGSWAVERGISSNKDAVKKIDYMFNNPDKRQEFGSNGRKAVLEKYDWDKVGKQWVELFERLGNEY